MNAPDDTDRVARFEALVMPHLNAAYNLARWMTRNSSDAEDISQEAMLRAFRFFDSFRGDDARVWLLTIVRNTCLTWMRRGIPQHNASEFDERIHTDLETSVTPESAFLRDATTEQVDVRSSNYSRSIGRSSSCGSWSSFHTRRSRP
jgi:RNA polymerase sigma-70 factor (ECF subfamily)